MRIMAGSSLLVPRSERHTKDVPEHVATQGRLEFQAEIRYRRITVLAKQGETVQQLAKRHRADPQVAALMNKLSANAKLKKKQRVVLLVPVSTQSAKAKPRTTKKKTSAKKSKPSKVAAGKKQ
jgi:membrane-bound lytic murein transglycosylase D